MKFKCPILGLLFGIIKQLLPSMDCKHQNCYPSRGCFPQAKALGKTIPFRLTILDAYIPQLLQANNNKNFPKTF
jgi:hypothetical protein